VFDCCRGYSEKVRRPTGNGLEAILSEKINVQLWVATCWLMAFVCIVRIIADFEITNVQFYDPADGVLLMWNASRCGHRKP